MIAVWTADAVPTLSAELAGQRCRRPASAQLPLLERWGLLRGFPQCGAYRL